MSKKQVRDEQAQVVGEEMPVLGATDRSVDPLRAAQLEARLLGQKMTFWCLNYIYSGDLTGVYEEMIELTNPIVIYETGEFDDPKWKDFSKLPHKIYIMKGNVESWGVLK